jgi:hypothetical protein
MELAAQDARAVPREVSRKQGQSKGAGANAKPAEVVLTTRAATQKQSRCSVTSKSPSWVSQRDKEIIFHINQPMTFITQATGKYSFIKKFTLSDLKNYSIYYRKVLIYF